ncbi:MAG: glycosyl hydrolase family 15, partial [Leptolyngbya sp. RL_3_1]|nr:glycosyl hydrolase family 15 [Leptolyngbya sp. RL_3_1]
SYTSAVARSAASVASPPPRIFRVSGETAVFLPSFLDPQKFYLTLDYHFLVAQIRSELAYIHYHWNEPGRPTMTLLLTHELFELGHKPIHESPLLNLIQELKDGSCGGVPVLLGPLYQLMLTAGTERIDNIGDYALSHGQMTRYHLQVSSFLTLVPKETQPLGVLQVFEIERQGDTQALVAALGRSHNLYEQIELLAQLHQIAGADFDTGLGQPDRTITVADLLEELYVKAGKAELWLIVRRAAGLLHKMDVNLSDAVTEILVRQKQVTVGKAYNEASLIRDPVPHTEILDKINRFCSEDERDRALTQEVLVYLSVLIKADPSLFDGLLTLRVGYLILLLTSELAREENVTRDEAYDRLTALSPHDIQSRLRQVLASYSGLNRSLYKRESLHAKAQKPVTWGVLPEQVTEQLTEVDWWRQRQIDGELTRLSQDFYQEVWDLLHHCQGVIIGDKLDRRNRVDSQAVLAEMTPGEANFARRLDHLLNKIHAPDYRHVTVEALRELAAIFKGNPDLLFEDHIVLDVLIGHAVRLAWIEGHPGRVGRYEGQKAAAWSSFYGRSPKDCALFMAKALQFLVELAEADEEAVSA